MARRRLAPEQPMPWTDRQALHHFVRLPVETGMIQYLAQQVPAEAQCVGLQQSRPGETLPPPALDRFIHSLYRAAVVGVGTLMASLVYLARIRKALQHTAEGGPLSPHGIFLGSLILAAKVLNDCSPGNQCWAQYSSMREEDSEVFGFRLLDVNRIERDLLVLLDFDVLITEVDLFHHFEPFLLPIRTKMEAALGAIQVTSGLKRKRIEIEVEDKRKTPKRRTKAKVKSVSHA
ncbi:uncharacterized protein PV07_12659 [Cladophialophora immunda]|uniref:Uncharacterized protein n=1 Tax=Cladophialophora immunda TaxID=569365 RepID=A0A0D2BSA7_9EURO|nr:uncharacterized protein PV07_12659 [Cladophialophora immunda]KIW21933.1 hypothetical protein PV07_12659 [Cladophialophora immunda]